MKLIGTLEENDPVFLNLWCLEAEFRNSARPSYKTLEDNFLWILEKILSVENLLKSIQEDRMKCDAKDTIASNLHKKIGK